MAACKVLAAALVFVGIPLVLGAASELKEGETCQTPNGESGTCTMIDNCPYLKNELREKLQLGPSLFKLSVELYKCGNQNGESLLCCAKPLVSKVTKEEVTEDVSEHHNVGLLDSDTCGPVFKERIANGTKTRLFESPWMALLLMKNGTEETTVCSGSLINKKYILTSAYCVDEINPNYVRLGDHDLKSEIDCEEDVHDGKSMCAPPPQEIEVEEVVPHPSYTRLPHVKNDIALLRLSQPANFNSDAVRTICLPTGLSQQTQNLQGETVHVSGWDLTDEGREYYQLIKITVPVLEHSKCSYFPNLSTVAQICTGSDVGGGHPCMGDSGDPLTRISEVQGNMRTLQYGIMSFGYANCTVLDQPLFYTHVGHYMKWILDNIKP